MAERAIVVLHGWRHSREVWQDVARRFPAYEVETIDLPGFGAEPLVADDWGVPEYAAWVEGQLSARAADSVILLGHSLGGRIASLIASRHPAWLHSLVLYGSPSLYRPRVSIRLRTFLARMARRLGLRRGSLGNAQLQSADRDGLGRIFRNVVPFDQTVTLPEIAVPTLLVWGTEDDEVPVSIADEMHRLIPLSQLVQLPNLGHNAHLENPTLFYGTIARFIESD